MLTYVNDQPDPIIIVILILTQINGQPDPWLALDPNWTNESGSKTMIITFLILMLTLVDGQPSSWLESSSGLAPSRVLKL